MSREDVLNRVLPQTLTEKIMGYVRDLEWSEHRLSYQVVLEEMYVRQNPCESIGHIWNVLEWYSGAWDSMALVECRHCKRRVVRNS
jgi:hypothetical protein